MKVKIKSMILFVLSVFFIVNLHNVSAQNQSAEMPESNPSKFKYETVKNDPLDVKIYTLPNGLKVYMSVYNIEPRIQAYVAVRAGSKHDPAESTGLAHYFEHMMFKGSKSFGTTNYEKESVYIAQVDSLFEVYRTLTDDKERRAMYRIIDSISIIASEYAIPNEYDKLMSIVGSSGTNAYTSVDQTVYIENVPSNQLENWAIIQADRFKNPVLRLFHTELETIYEEKNMTLTSDMRKAYTALLEGMFPNHPYGTQTTIGTQESLKNPSMKNIREFHASYYVPNNIAIVLSGDFDPEEAIKIISEKFGDWAYSELPKFTFEKEKPINTPVIKEVVGPEAESIFVGFRFSAAKSKDANMIKLVDMILMNSSAGLFDINLKQKQEVLNAYSYNVEMEDYTALVLGGNPKAGQSLDQVKDLLLAQIEIIKKGEFDDWLIPAIINDLKLQQIKSFESNESRASAMVNAFVHGMNWEDYVNQIRDIEKISKKDVIDFVNKNFSENYVVVYKRSGRDESIQKIAKNRITPIKINRDAESDFLVMIRDNKVEQIEPHFLDFKTDISVFNVKNVPVSYIQNTENETFNLYYVFDMGSYNDKKLKHAIEYLDFVGTDKYTPEQIKQEFYKIGCTYGVFSSGDQVYVRLSGLALNMEAGISLLEHLLANAAPNAKAWENYVENTLKKRTDAKKNVQFIFSALVSYGMYGDDNPFKWQLSEKEIKNINPADMTAMINGLSAYKHKILFYGSQDKQELSKLITKYHNVPETFKDYPTKKKFNQKPTTKNIVYFVDFETPHTQILMLNRGEQNYSKNKAGIIRLFNEYFGGSMNSIVFQEMRESKGLAYTAMSFYQEPGEADQYYTGLSYIATQFDKIEEAVNGFYELKNNMPLAEKSFDIAKESVIQNIRTDRIVRANILFARERANKLGIDEDIRKTVFNDVQGFTIQDVKEFQMKNLKDQSHTILVLGSKKDVPAKTLKKFGKVKNLKMDKIFGY